MTDGSERGLEGGDDSHPMPARLFWDEDPPPCNDDEEEEEVPFPYVGCRSFPLPYVNWSPPMLMERLVCPDCGDRVRWLLLWLLWKELLRMELFNPPVS
jgi:hypothetical protein